MIIGYKLISVASQFFRHKIIDAHEEDAIGIVVATHVVTYDDDSLEIKSFAELCWVFKKQWLCVVDRGDGEGIERYLSPLYSF